MDQRGPRLLVTRRSTSYIKRILLVEDVDLFITYGIVWPGFICALNAKRMDILRGCAIHRKLTSEVTFTSIKSQGRRIDNSSQTEKRKSEKKIQRDRDRIRVFNEKRLFLAELPFPRVKDSQFNEELTKNKLEDAK